MKENTAEVCSVFTKENQKMNKSILGKLEDNVYTEYFRTYSYNEDSHLNAKLEWCFQIAQEVAGCHAALANCSIEDLKKVGKTWVITQEKIKVHRYPSWPEQIKVQTWINKPQGLTLPRSVVAYDANDKVLFELCSYWVILDLNKNFRPVPPSFITKDLCLPSSKPVEAEKPKKIKEKEGRLFNKITPQIYYSDTDNNQHVNNISYLQWALNSMENEFRNQYKTEKLYSTWQKQTFSEDEVEMITTTSCDNPYENDEVEFYHKLIKKDDESVIAWQGHSIWKRRDQLT